MNLKNGNHDSGFLNKNQNTVYFFNAKVGVSKTVRQTVDKLAETGWLYNKVRKYADSRSTDRAFGLVGQVWDAQLIWWLCNMLSM